MDANFLTPTTVKDLGENRKESPPTGAPKAGGVGKNRRFSSNVSLYLRNGGR